MAGEHSTDLIMFNPKHIQNGSTPYPFGVDPVSYVIQYTSIRRLYDIQNIT